MPASVGAVRQRADERGTRTEPERTLPYAFSLSTVIRNRRRLAKVPRQQGCDPGVTPRPVLDCPRPKRSFHLETGLQRACKRRIVPYLHNGLKAIDTEFSEGPCSEYRKSLRHIAVAALPSHGPAPHPCQLFRHTDPAEAEYTNRTHELAGIDDLYSQNEVAPLTPFIDANSHEVCRHVERLLHRDCGPASNIRILPCGHHVFRILRTQGPDEQSVRFESYRFHASRPPEGRISFDEICIISVGRHQ
ncbi:hypothetical protein SAMN05216483_1269 [Streptomyces sp. 2131.1]|nr:hypothetical protein SAMN05216483_1269 [Streptomyces sp. 2131.1]